MKSALGRSEHRLCLRLPPFEAGPISTEGEQWLLDLRRHGVKLAQRVDGTSRSLEAVRRLCVDHVIVRGDWIAGLAALAGGSHMVEAVRQFVLQQGADLTVVDVTDIAMAHAAAACGAAYLEGTAVAPEANLNQFLC